jgi:hypothetical protein
MNKEMFTKCDSFLIGQSSQQCLFRESFLELILVLCQRVGSAIYMSGAKIMNGFAEGSSAVQMHIEILHTLVMYTVPDT